MEVNALQDRKEPYCSILNYSLVLKIVDWSFALFKASKCWEILRYEKCYGKIYPYFS